MADDRTKPTVMIREAVPADRKEVSDLMARALEPYYGGDHRRHAERIFETHISGGVDRLGFFSFEQKMFVATVDGRFAGMVHVVGKRQQTYKISPLIVKENFRKGYRVGGELLRHATEYARVRGARQLYCTVAEQNAKALQFFLSHGFVRAGFSLSHYKSNVTEVMLYFLLDEGDSHQQRDELNIAVLPYDDEYAEEVQSLLLSALPSQFSGIDESWVESLFEGYRRRDARDINSKFKLIFIATEPSGRVLGVAGATPKKGSPIKIMPLVSLHPAAFEALLRDIPFMLREYGDKLYVHLVPTAEDTALLQRLGWTIDAAMPEAYSKGVVTQQWSFSLAGEKVRNMRVKKRFFDLIMSGVKDLEVRVGYDAIKAIKPGELLQLSTSTEIGYVRVEDVRIYRTFAELFDVEDPRRIAPDDPATIESLLREFYPPKKEGLGVYVLEIAPASGPLA